MAKSLPLTHLDQSGKARMVDVSQKPESVRTAVARGAIILSKEAFAKLKRAELAKGDALAVARIAGIQAAKHTWELIPLCHQIPLAGITIEFALSPKTNAVTITAEVKTSLAQTGVEMEAMTAVSVAALTIFDMTKSISHEHRIELIELLHKSGGKTGTWQRPQKKSNK